MSDIGVLVVTNKYEITRNFVLNYLKYFFLEDNYLLILDNDSSDKTCERIKEEFPLIDIRRLNGNYGTVTGRNVGIVEIIKLGCKYIYISDNDVLFNDSEYFNKLRNFMECNPALNGCCPVVRWFENGEIQTLGSRMLSKYKIKSINVIDDNHSINTLPGCAAFIKAETFEKYGIYDNDLSPISIEDFEWGIRMTKQGLKFNYFDNAEIFHLHKKSDSGSKEKIRHVIRGRTVFLRKYFNSVNLLKEMKKIFSYILKFGLFFTVKNYYSGFRIKLTENNYEFSSFKKIYKKYYSI